VENIRAGGPARRSDRARSPGGGPPPAAHPAHGRRSDPAGPGQAGRRRPRAPRQSHPGGLHHAAAGQDRERADAGAEAHCQAAETLHQVAPWHLAGGVGAAAAAAAAAATPWDVSRFPQPAAQLTTAPHPSSLTNTPLPPSLLHRHSLPRAPLCRSKPPSDASSRPSRQQRGGQPPSRRSSSAQPGDARCWPSCAAAPGLHGSWLRASLVVSPGR